ncbi:MAG: hypothetical protein L0154_30335 [Chloroflexi bacterium]|nr:hypothetical protein [Chloroflexota bacterium]
MRILLLSLLFLTLLVTACDNNNDPQEPIVVVATNAAPDSGFNTYQHPSEVFSIRVPPNWVVDELPDENGVRVQFSVLEDTESIVRLTVYVVNAGLPMTRETFLAASDSYQPPEDIADFDWQPIGSPIDMSDGSRRVTGVRVYPLTGARALNIFMQGNGTYFSALEIDVTDASEETIQRLNAVANTFRVNPDASMEVGEVVAASSFTGDVGFDSLMNWNDDAGGFNITGRVLNLTNSALEAVRVTGYLFDTNDNRLTEKSLILTTDVLQAGGTAPFRLRFEGGRPSTAVRFEMHAAARVANLNNSDFYGPENFDVQENDAYYNDNGKLVISGQVANIGSRLAKGVKVVIGMLDENNNVVGAETVFINKDELLPADVGTYDVAILDVGGAAVRYELSVMGQAE